MPMPFALVTSWFFVLVSLACLAVGLVRMYRARRREERRDREMERLQRIEVQFDGVCKALVAHVPGLYPDPDAMTREAVEDALGPVLRALDACEAYFDAQGEFASKRWGDGYEELSRARARFRGAMVEIPRRSKRRAA